MYHLENIVYESEIRFIPEVDSNARRTNSPDRSPLLSRPSEKITTFDDDLQALADNMFKIMDKERGAGLAAVQIGRPVRLIVMDVPDHENERLRLPMVNPNIIHSSTETVSGIEGCLSMPNYDMPVERYNAVTVEYMDTKGRMQVLHATGQCSICVQHEVDHTNGILLYDRVSRLRRQRAKDYFRRVRRDALRT